MVIGEYPCCGGDFSMAVPDVTPAYKREECPYCDEVVWHVLSRLDPISYSEAEFLAEYDVDYAAKRITKKGVANGETLHSRSVVG